MYGNGGTCSVHYLCAVMCRRDWRRFVSFSTQIRRLNQVRHLFRNYHQET